MNAAAARVHERTELLALDAAEAYVDVTRYLRVITIAEDTSGFTEIFSRTLKPALTADAQ